MGARWYDPTSASFRSRDTVFGELTTPISLNRYTYAYANPLTYWDPDGRCPRDPSTGMCMFSSPTYTKKVSTGGHANIGAGGHSASIYSGKTKASHDAAIYKAAAVIEAEIIAATTVPATATIAATDTVVSHNVDDVCPQTDVGCQTSGKYQDRKVQRAIANGCKGGSDTSCHSAERRFRNDTIVNAGPLRCNHDIGSRFLCGLIFDRVADAMETADYATRDPLGFAIGAAGCASNAVHCGVESGLEMAAECRADRVRCAGRIVGDVISIGVGAAQVRAAGQLGAVPSGARMGDGRVQFRPPPGATAGEIAQVRAYVDGCNQALCDGLLSPTGRVSTQGELRVDASAAAAAERARAANAGYPYTGHVGHVPDATWTGRAVPPAWLDLEPRVNMSLGGQASHYPVGFRPTGFDFVD